MHPYTFLIFHAIFHPGYVSVTTGGLPSDHGIKGTCTFDTLALLVSLPHYLRTPAHLTGNGIQIQFTAELGNSWPLPSGKDAEYLRNDFPEAKQKSLDFLISYTDYSGSQTVEDRLQPVTYFP